MKKLQLQKSILPSIFVFFLLFILCSQFGYYVDDLYWGMDSRISSFIDSFTNPENPFHFYNNGRYFGNALGFICANHCFVRNLIMAAALWMIFYLTAKISSVTVPSELSLPNFYFIFFISGSVLLSLPKEMFRQSIAWSAAFMNYVVPSALYLMCLKILFDRKTRSSLNFLYLFLPLTASFFVENLTIGNAVFICLWIACGAVRKEKITANEWLYAAGAMIGMIVMMSDDGYRQIINGDPAETYWSAQAGSIVLMIRKAWNSFSLYAAGAVTGHNVILLLFITISLAAALFLTEKTMKTSERNLCKGISLLQLIISVYFTLRKASPSWDPFSSYTGVFDAGITVIFLLSIPLQVLLLPYTPDQKKIVCFSWIFSLCITAPLLVAEPLSDRVFFPTVVFLMLTGCEIAFIDRELAGKNDQVPRILPYLAAVFLSIWLFLFSIYAVNAHYERERIKYVKHQGSLGYHETVFPKLPYDEYVVESYPWNEEWQERYRLFYGIDPGIRFYNIIDFEEWKLYL
ncbi:MAG: hypothetical protein IKP86_12125 [Anaerolineaceae bacterium]|nr:hypothetical protein [Anaerolineaceae bacterium]